MRPVRWIIDTAGSVTGTRFRMIVGSSAIATASILAGAMASGRTQDLAEAILASGIGAERGPATTAEAPPAPVPAAPVQQAAAPPPSGPTAAPSAVAPTPQVPVEVPEEEEPDRGLSRVRNVFVVSLTSPGYEKSFGSTSEMPYLSQTLRPKGQLLSNYSLIAAKGLPNYIAMTSGQRPNNLTSQDCPTYSLYGPTAAPNKQGFVTGDGCVYPIQMTTLLDQMNAEPLKWHGYFEDMANPDTTPTNQTPTAPRVPTCVRPTVNQPDPTQKSRPGNGYAASNNPFIYYRSLTDLGTCVPNVVPLDRLEGEIASPGTTPNFSFIQPNLCNAGAENPCVDQSDGGAKRADEWLKTWIPKLEASQGFKQGGLIVVTFNETSLASPTSNEKVGTLLISPWLRPGSEDVRTHNPYSMFKTLEDIYGFDYLAAARARSTTAFSKPLVGNGTSIAPGDN